MPYAYHAGAPTTGTDGGGQSSETRPGSLLGTLMIIGGASPLRAADQDSLSGEAKERKGEVWGTNRS